MQVCAAVPLCAALVLQLVTIDGEYYDANAPSPLHTIKTLLASDNVSCAGRGGPSNTSRTVEGGGEGGRGAISPGIGSVNAVRQCSWRVQPGECSSSCECVDAAVGVSV